MNTTITTVEAVAYLRRLGLPVTAGALRKDVQRGLVRPGMPAADPQGRGTAARWTLAALRRLEYLARLRRRRANGQALPLLAFVYDGWGWASVLPVVQRSVRRAASTDRRALRRLGSAHSSADVLLNLDTGTPDEGPFDYRTELLPGRQALWTGAILGAPAPGTSLTPMLRALAESLTSVLTGIDPAAVAAAGARLEEGRRGAALAAGGVADWLAGLPPAEVEVGWVVLHAYLEGYRALLRSAGSRPSNPLALGTTSRKARAESLRSTTGRLSTTTALATLIAQAMVHASYVERAEVPVAPKTRRAAAPLSP